MTCGYRSWFEGLAVLCEARQLDEGAFSVCRSRNVVGSERFQHRDLVATLEFRATEAVFPGFERQLPTINNAVTKFIEETINISEREDGAQAELAALRFELSHEFGA